MTACSAVAPQDPAAPTRDVLFKAELLPVAAQSPAVHWLLQRHVPSHVPRLVAGRAFPDGSWLLLDQFTGTPVETLDPFDGLPRMARAVAAVQAALADLETREADGQAALAPTPGPVETAVRTVYLDALP